MNLLQCRFCFLFWVFWPQGMWDLTSSTRDRTCIPCPGRPNLNHQGSPSDLNLSECVKNVLGQKSIAWRAEKYLSKIFQKMCAGHKPGLAELQTFYKFFFFSISFFLITKIFQLFMMDLIKKKKKRLEVYILLKVYQEWLLWYAYIFFQISLHFLVQFFVNWQLNPVKLWKNISKDYPRNYFGNCACQKAKMQSHTKKKPHFVIRLNSLLSLEYSRFTWWSRTSQIMAEARAWSSKDKQLMHLLVGFGFSAIDMSFLLSAWTFVLKMTSYWETIKG